MHLNFSMSISIYKKKNYSVFRYVKIHKLDLKFMYALKYQYSQTRAHFNMKSVAFQHGISYILRYYPSSSLSFPVPFCSAAGPSLLPMAPQLSSHNILSPSLHHKLSFPFSLPPFCSTCGCGQGLLSFSMAWFRHSRWRRVMYSPRLAS